MFLLKNNNFPNQHFPADLPAVSINTQLPISNWFTLLHKPARYPKILGSLVRTIQKWKKTFHDLHAQPFCCLKGRGKNLHFILSMEEKSILWFCSIFDVFYSLKTGKIIVWYLSFQRWLDFPVSYPNMKDIFFIQLNTGDNVLEEKVKHLLMIKKKEKLFMQNGPRQNKTWNITL